MPTKKKKILIQTPDDIMSAYMEYFENTPDESISLEDFIDAKDIDSASFSSHFDSIQNIEEQIWSYIFRRSLETVESDLNPEMQSTDNKILALFFTFFQNLSMNDDYFKKHLNHRKSVLQKNRLYSGMKTFFKSYMTQLHESSCSTAAKIGGETIDNLLTFGFVNSYWAELLLLIEFWLKDGSPEYEKTDVAIEKTLKASQEIRSIEPLKSVIDLGKFIWTESFFKAK